MQRRMWGLLAAAAMWSWAATSSAQVGTEHAASILVFPKVVADGTRDTTIQISNTSSSAVNLRCWYTNAALVNPDLPPGPLNPPQWQTQMFALGLTRNQPTVWVVSRGRPFDPPTSVCLGDAPPYDCEGSGLDPGDVPPVADGFTGELRCIEIESSGAPLSGNHLIGDASIITLATGDVSRYSALGIVGLEANDGDASLVLGTEYDACPARWRLEHAPDGALVPGAGANSSVATELTVVPCSADFENQVPATAVLQLGITNELEQHFSASTTVTCWGSFRLSDIASIFHVDALVTDGVQTVVRPSSSSGAFLLLVEETRTVDTGTTISAIAAANVHGEGTTTATDVIAIPSDLVP